MLLMLLVCSAFFYLPRLHTYEEALRKEYMEEAATRDQLTSMTGLEILQYNNIRSEDAKEEVSFREQLRIALPEGLTEDEITVEDDYLTQTITVTLPGADNNYMLNYPIIGSSDHITSLTYESSGTSGFLDIVTDQVFEYTRRFEEGYLYLDFVDPHALYEKVVVIDAGHGGSMPGATRQGIYEKDIDLAITRELDAIFSAQGDDKVRVYYTRLDDSNPSFENRVGLANKSNADVFISIHNNAATTRSSVSGTTVLYDETKGDGEKSSKHLAEICAEEVTAALGSKNQGLTDGNEIYIIRNATVPVALIEVGFMTNAEELTKLTSPEYQHEAALGIYHAIERAFAEGY